MRPHLALVAFLALPPAVMQRGSATFDLPAYLAELDRVRTAIAAASTPEEAAALSAALPDRWWVAVDDQVTVVDMRWMEESIRASTADTSRWASVRDQIGQRLATMRASALEDSRPPVQAPGQALEAVLARPEFQSSATSRWLDEQRTRVGAWLLRTLNRLSGTGLSGRTMAITFAWIVSIAMLAALAFWFVRMLTRRSHAAALELRSAAPRRAPAREWALRALAAARAGDLREAIRSGYHAALCRLDEQGIWTVDDSRTPREYLSLLRGDDPRHPVVLDLTRRFEQVWYGRKMPTMDDARRVSEHLERLGCVRESERAI